MRRTCAVVCLLGSAIGSAFAAPHPKVAKALSDVNPGSHVDVIIQYRDGVKPEHVQKVGATGGKHKKSFDETASALFSVAAGSLNELAEDPDVTSISPNRQIKGQLDAATATLGVPTAWNLSYNGSGVGIAIIDSGIRESLKDFGNALGRTGTYGRVVYQENFLEPLQNRNGDPNESRYKAEDKYGHGTHVAGIIAGNGILSAGTKYTRTFRGIAPEADLVILKVLDDRGVGDDATVIAAIDRAIKLKGTYNIRVINLSLGRRVFDSFTKDPLCQAVERAWKAGIVVVVAAGNEGRLKDFGTDGYGTITAPGNDPLVITVGAMKSGGTGNRSNDLIASYSSKGPTMIDHVVKPDLVAPGNNISAPMNDGFLFKTYYENVVDPLAYQTNVSLSTRSNYYQMSGTSTAAPMVSGAAALLLQKNSKLKPDQVKAILMMTATKNF